MNPYFVVEGPDGAGKSTLVESLKVAISERRAVKTYRHPGATPVGDAIRTLVKNRIDIKMNRYTEQILIAADYAEFIMEELIPNLDTDTVCLSDRSNLISGMVYGLAGGLSEEQVMTFQNICMRIMPPFHLIVVSAPYEALMERRHHDQEGKCRFEMRGDPFHKAVADLYCKIGEDCLTDNFVGRQTQKMTKAVCYIDAINSPEAVLQQALEFVWGSLAD